MFLIVFDPFQGPFKKMPVDINAGIPLSNNFASSNSICTAEDIQNCVDEMFKLGYQDGLRSLMSNPMQPSTSGTLNPILNDQQSDVNFVKLTTDASKFDNNMEIGNEETQDQKWYSEFEEMKNAKNQKVNIIFVYRKIFIYAFQLHVYYRYQYIFVIV